MVLLKKQGKNTKFITKNKGGEGAVREIADLIHKESEICRTYKDFLRIYPRTGIKEAV